MSAPEHVVVVGGGLAAARTVQELTAQGHRGRVTLVGAEPHPPYDRPPLSKAVLQGAADDSTLDVDWSGVDVRLGVTATGLRPGVLETDAGDVQHDALVLATGSVPSELPGQPPTAHVLRTLDDARRLRAALVAGARVVVVGAGWIGAEVATAASAAGCRTTVLEAGPAPLPVLGDVGAHTAAWYAACGVELRTAAAVAAVEPDGVVLAAGERLTADVVVVGVGADPATGWLTGSGLELDGGGVVVDEHLATSQPGVVAVGDCAAWWSRRYGARLRVEHWDEALRGPAVAVSTLLGTGAVHDPVPYFWSEQLGHRLQLAGYHRTADAVVHRGEPGSDDGWTVCWLTGGRLDAVLAVDRPRDLAQARRLIAAGAHPDPGRLADPAVAVKDV